MCQADITLYYSSSGRIATFRDILGNFSLVPSDVPRWKCHLLYTGAHYMSVVPALVRIRNVMICWPCPLDTFARSLSYSELIMVRVWLPMASVGGGCRCGRRATSSPSRAVCQGTAAVA